MDSRQYRNLIELQRRTFTGTGADKVPAWSTYTRVYAKIEMLNSRDQTIAKGFEQVSTGKVSTRRGPDVKASDRIVYSDRGVTHYLTVTGLPLASTTDRNELIIYVSEISNGT